ncbi:phage tail protein [Enterococcus gallinarum]|nr:phage tail protein [Enterococcus gallinarum]
MDFYFTDRKFNLLGIASASNDAPISIYNDQDVLSISAASRTFEGTLIFSDKERDKVKAMANYGNYILYKDENGQSIFMTIMEIEHDPKEGEHFIRAEDAGMDLINGLVDAYSATKAMTFAEYFKLFAGDTGFEIGINEISNLNRTLKWESESQTILARLLSLATQFDNAEISFSFEITGMQVVKRFVDVRKKRGADNRVTLYMDKDINNIVTKANIYDLCTAIVATGGTPEGKNEPINLKGYNYKDPNGRFVLNKTTGVMLDMESVKIWSRLLSNNNPNPNAGHIQRVKTYETTDQKTLCDNVIRELEKASQPAINYETDIANLPDNVKIGDTIYLVDENEKLFLSARVLELTRCYSTNEYKATLGDYLIQDGGISQSLKELADQLKQATTYVWIRYADDEEGNGISALPAGKTYIAIKQVLGVPTASDDPADYRGLWVKFVGEGVPGPPGENGQPTYTWLKYADDYQGTNMTDDPTGKYYIGLATNKLTATESNDPKDYKWQLVKGEDGQDAHIYQAYSWSPDGTDRFATTYPNENLFSGDVAVQTYSSVSSNNASTYPITKEIRTESNFYFSRIRRSNPTQNPKVFSIFNGINLPEDFAAKLAGKKSHLVC